MSRGPQRVRREVERSDAASSTPDCIESGRLGQRKTREKSPFLRDFAVYRLSPVVRNEPESGLSGKGLRVCGTPVTGPAGAAKWCIRPRCARHLLLPQVYFLLYGIACHHVHGARPRPRSKPRLPRPRWQAPQRLPHGHVSNASRSARMRFTNAAAAKTDIR